MRRRASSVGNPELLVRSALAIATEQECARDTVYVNDRMHAFNHSLRQLSRDLAWLRLIASAGQALAIVAAIVWLKLTISVAALMAGVTALATGGALGLRRTQTSRPIGPAEVIGYFAFDILELAYMLYLTG